LASLKPFFVYSHDCEDLPNVSHVPASFRVLNIFQKPSGKEWHLGAGSSPYTDDCGWIPEGIVVCPAKKQDACLPAKAGCHCCPLRCLPTGRQVVNVAWKFAN